MTPAATSPVTHTGDSTSRDELISRLSAKTHAAFERFEADRNAARLGPVLLAILEDCVPHTPARPLAEFPGNARLIADLGFDSLSLSEAVLHAEDLFVIRLSNTEITAARTLDDLRDLIARKVAGPAPG
jgi:acyl carrier protein